MSDKLLRQIPKAVLVWYPFKRRTRRLIISRHESLIDLYRECIDEEEAIVEAFLLGDIEAALLSKEHEVSFACIDEKTDGITDDIGGLNSYVDTPNCTQESSDVLERIGHNYDYIVVLDALEYMKKPLTTLQYLWSLLSENGILLMGMDNRLGLRYFCGDRDKFTDRNFDSIDGYYRINLSDRQRMEGRSYSKDEVMTILREVGIEEVHSFSVLPCMDEPQLIYAEDYLPEESMNVRYNAHYNYPETVFLEEKNLCSDIIKNGLFHQMANGYLLECAKQSGGCVGFNTIKHATVTIERGEENSLVTMIKRDGTVVKKAIYSEGRDKLNRLYENDQYLKQRGINVIDSHLEDDEYVMPYVKGEPATDYFRRLFETSLRQFIRELTRFFDIILSSSETVSYEEIDWYHYAPGWEKQKDDNPNKDKWYKIAHSEQPEALGKIMKKGFIDLVTINCFVVDGEFVFYDQEFTVENLPAYTILWRSIELIYRNNIKFEQTLPMKELCKMMGMGDYVDFFAGFSHQFIGKLRHWDELREYHREHGENMNLINSNRQRMNYSQEEYQRLFVDIFGKTEGRKIYLFGSGNFAKKFLSEFSDEYEFAGILDNCSAKYGEYLENVEIMSPDILKDMNPNKYKIIICVKNYVPIIKQLRSLGATNYSLYDWSMAYEHRNKESIDNGSGLYEVSEKPYHVGYIAGVFDLFHIGHLNLLKRAKEQCDYLIVGVVSDEGVIRNKKTSPYIPFTERVEIVRSCKYVDEAVEIPADYNDTDEAFRRYHFDVQFSGSDYANDPDWLDKQAYLRKKGADLVFFPYTQGTSSTKLKSVIASNSNHQKKQTDDKLGDIESADVESAQKNIEGTNKMIIASMTNPAIEPHRPNQGFDIHKKAGYNNMVLRLADFIDGVEIRRYGQKVITTDVQRYEKVSDNPELLWKYGMEYVRHCREKGIEISAIEAPYIDRDTKREDLDEFLLTLAKESIHLCKDAGAKYVLIRPNSYKQNELTRITTWYDRLAPLAKENGVTILVSNQCKDVSGHLVRGVFANPTELADWIDLQNEKHGVDTFGAYVDVGTYNLCGQNMQDEVVTLDDRIKAVVIRENDGHHESSMLPYTCVTEGKDDMDYTGLIRGLRQIDYDGILILDMFHSVGSVPTKLRGGIVDLGKEFMDFLTWQIGMEKGLRRYSKRVLFGAGNMCRAYMKCYGEEFPPLFTCDNNAKLWGSEFCGLSVRNPEELMDLPEDCVIYICNMFYNEIEKQLRDMGVTNPIEFFNDEYMPSYHFTRI